MSKEDFRQAVLCLFRRFKGKVAEEPNCISIESVNPFEFMSNEENAKGGVDFVKKKKKVACIAKLSDMNFADGAIGLTFDIDEKTYEIRGGRIWGLRDGEYSSKEVSAIEESLRFFNFAPAPKIVYEQMSLF